MSSALQQEKLALRPKSDRQIWDDLRLAWGGQDTANLDCYRTALEAARAKAVKESLVDDLRANILPGLVDVATRTGQTEGVDTLLAEWKQLIELSRVPADWVSYYQYRAHLEIAQGRIPVALRDLSRAIEIDEASGVQDDPCDLETPRAERDAVAGDTRAARQRLEQLREQALRWSHGWNRLAWLAISAYTAAGAGDNETACQDLAQYRRLYRDLGRGEKPGGYEPLLRQLSPAIHGQAGEILARGASPSAPTGFVFERDVPVNLPPRVQSQRDGRTMLLVPYGFAPIDGKRQPWLVPAFYIDAEPVTVEQYSSLFGQSPTGARGVQLSDGYVDMITFAEARAFALRAGKELPEDFDLWRAAAAFSFPSGLAEINEGDLLAGLAAGPLPVCPKFTLAKWPEVVASKAVTELCDQIVARYAGSMPDRVVRALAASLSLPVEKRLALMRTSNAIDGDRLQLLEKILEREASLLDRTGGQSELWAVWWMRLYTLAKLLGLEGRGVGNAVTGAWTCSRPYLGPRSRRLLRVAFIPEPWWEADARTSRLGPVVLAESERLCGLGIRCIRRIRCASDANDLNPLEETTL